MTRPAPAVAETRYLLFLDCTPEGRRTKIVSVRSQSSGYQLAEIRWHGPWRQYTLRPEPNTIWNVECLADIRAVIDKLMEDWRAQSRPVRNTVQRG